MATVMEPGGRFEIGRVFGRSFGVISRNLPLYLGLTLLLVGLPRLAIGLSMALPPGTTLEALRTGAVSLATVLSGGVVNYILSLILQATLVRATIEDLSDRRPRFGDCLATGLRVLLPVLGIAVVSTIGVFLGILLVVVPGIILALMWSLAVPAEVEERGGVFASLSRSQALTSGNRWKLLFLIIITALAVGFIQVVLNGIAMVFDSTTRIILSALVGAIMSTVMVTVIAASYVELRIVKEGADVNALAAVFH